MAAENNLGKDKVSRLVWRIAIPSMLAQFVSVLYSIVDRIYISNLPAIGDVALAGVACYGLCVVFQLVTLPTEFNASHRALRAIEESALLLPEEQTAAKRVLTAAALTYVAALSVTIMQFLRLLLIVAGGNRRRD